MAEVAPKTNTFINLIHNNKLVFITLGGKQLAYYGTHDTFANTLRKDNMAGKDIYFTVAELKPGTIRTKDKFISCSAVWLDDDGDKHGVTDPSKFPIMPNIKVTTSPGKHHYYWLTHTTDGDQLEAVLRRIANEYHGDPAVCDRTRVMRLPGYTHIGSGKMAEYEVLHENTYAWSEIIKAFPPMDISVDSKPIDDKPFEMQAAVQDIIAGNDIHMACVRIAMHNANTNVSQVDTLAQLKGYVQIGMDMGTITLARGKERLANMDGRVKSAYSKVTLEQAPKYVDDRELDEGKKYTKIQPAPGALGEIANDIMRYMPHPQYEMAVTVAQHIVSVFGGGLFHIHNRPMNRKRTLLAASGTGKSIADKYYNEIIRLMAISAEVINPYLFNGNNSYAVNNMHVELLEHRVRSYIVSEAGLMGKTTAGTTSETRAYILNLISASIKSAINAKLLSVRTKENRDMNDHLKTIHGAVAVILSESVPNQYVDVLNNSEAFLSGDVAREELVFVDPHKQYFNTYCEEQVEAKIINMCISMVQEFENQGKVIGDDPLNATYFREVKTHQIDEQLSELATKCVDEQNQHNAQGDSVSAVLYSRMYEKVMVTCMVQAVADAYWHGTTPVVTPEMYNWAYKYHEELIRSLNAQRRGSGVLADPMEGVMDRLISSCKSFGERSIDKTYAIDFQKRIISRKWLSKILDRSKLKALDLAIRQRGNNREMVNREILQMAEDLNLITPVPRSKGQVQHWRINT